MTKLTMMTILGLTASAALAEVNEIGKAQVYFVHLQEGMSLGLHSLLFPTKVKATAADMTCDLALFASDSLALTNRLGGSSCSAALHGAEVTSPFPVVFGLKGMGVAPAGVDPTVFKQVGHHHLFINNTLTADMAGQVVPADDSHLHFGGGQTETMLSLAPGRYQLQLVLADPYHRIHQPAIASPAISITVTGGDHED